MNKANKKESIKTILGRVHALTTGLHSFEETPVKHYGHAKSKWEDKEVFVPSHLKH